MAQLDLQTALPILERSLEFFRPHHLELRRRLITICLAIVSCTVVAYIFAEKIAMLFISPLFEASPLMYKLVYTNLPEAFIAYIKLALLIGIIFSMPVILAQCWFFVAPGLKESEKRFALIIVFWATLLFAGGVCFSFFIVLPKMLYYFMSYASHTLEPLPKLGKYLTFVARTLLAFGISFQIPFLMVMAGKTNLVQPKYFSKNRTYFYIAIAILSFLLTVGDLIACILLAFPLFLLYEAGLALSRIFSTSQN